MNTICPQCGSVLPSGERACRFCDSLEAPTLSGASLSTEINLEIDAVTREEWRGELNQRLQAYRARRRKASANQSQAALPFEAHEAVLSNMGALKEIALGVEEPEDDKSKPPDDFAFTVAIGRMARKPETAEPQLLIDVSTPPESDSHVAESVPEQLPPVQKGLFPVASLDERRRALVIDAACLAFAYGGFLALFGSLGGHFTLSKLSAAVCFFTFAFVYLQYFGLFTIFGGSTPGMMVSGLQVASSTGDVPSPRQYLLRAVGYMLSAGTCFLGFLWVLWDEDGLTWHDRLSHTYLTNVELLAEDDASQPAAAR